MSNLPRHVAIIMDGNGRWAQQQEQPRVKGHEKGAEVVRDIMTFASRHDEIRILTLYAFSTENWKRPKAEVEFLMKLLSRYLKKEQHVYLENNVRFHAIGDLSRFSASLQKLIRQTEEKTAHCTGLHHHLALNYGAKDEIIRAVKTLQHDGIELTEEALDAALDATEPVDLLIRTGGDQRLSNFLLWQVAYAELFFTRTLWPDFTPHELQSIIDRFKSVERRFGGL
ncbi:di-trans,poly-cis-decaprenylcistransferase [Sulfurimonas sp. HSL-1656]|uniref:di-trans,poly-cis-decaprenylcistransferase n=1 Tax=Thiomicrolovo subterrani TaxID=3131934 RepID=UPI0031F9CC88